jgi:mutator protein MutT
MKECQRVAASCANVERGETAIAVAVVLHDGAVLVGRREPPSPLSGLWEFPGGKVEPGESPVAAAVRECREESGLNVEVVALMAEQVEQYEHGRVRLYFFRCRLRRSPGALAASFRWVALSELATLSFPRGNRHVIGYLTDPGAEPAR